MNIPLAYGQKQIEESNRYYNSHSSSNSSSYEDSDNEATKSNTVESLGTIFNSKVPAAIILGSIFIGIGAFVCFSIFRKKS